ncbi:MAG: hypothetical protein CMC70_12715 [Flavobacteriaceae bacterium]|nr:hypothetical protein [Flavobacteriaceae bacterium]
MSQDKGKLKRSLGLVDTVFLAMGVILGAGIYAIIGEATGLAGNMIWLAFLIAAFVALLSALSYAEFVSRFPDAGGSFEYIKQTFGMKTALFFGFAVVCTGIIASAAIAISFADYLQKLWDLPNWTAILGITVILGLIDLIGVKHSSLTNIIATVITLIGLVFVVALGFPYIGETDLLEFPENGFTGILAAGALSFFAYVGFEDVVKTSEETKNPRKTVSRGILIAAAGVTVIYVLVAMSTVSLESWQNLAGSGSPLATAIEGEVGQWGITGLIVVALFATANSIQTNIIGTSRLVYDISRDSELKWMKKLAYIPKKLSTPVFATAAIVSLVIAFAMIGNLKIVASISNLFVYIVFLAVNVSLITWRIRNKNKERAPFHIPLNFRNVPIPTILAIASLLLMLGFNIYNLSTGALGGH